MNPGGSFEQPSGEVRKVAPRFRAQRIPAPNPQLFEDTSMQQPSYGYPTSNVEYASPLPPAFNQQAGYNVNVASQYGGHSSQVGGGVMFSGQPFISGPVADMAVQYGHTLAGQGTEFVHKNIEHYVTTSKLKYYFAVDTTYVGKKLGLLLFPYAHSGWSLRYNPEEPVAPRYDVNAPDLYIPVMAFVTYVLLAGVVLGTQSRFSPEQLGITATTALIWTVIEILALLFSMYIMNISSSLKLLDLLSYCGYKYIGMIVILLASLAFYTTGYYVALGWMSLSIAFFLVRSLHVILMSETDSESFSRGNKRRLYTLLVIAVAQPLLMWWLTWRLAPAG